MDVMDRENIRDRIRDDGEYRAPYISDAMVNAFINGGIRILHAKLVRLVPERFKTTTDISIVSGTSTYSLPADFMRATGVFLADSSAPSGYVRVPRYMARDKHLSQYIAGDKYAGQYEIRGGTGNVRRIEVYPPPTYSATWQVEYAQKATELTADDTDYAGEDLELEWIINHGLMKCAMKSEDDNFGLYKDARDEAWAEIRANIEADDVGPVTVTNVQDRDERARRKPGRW